MTLRVPIEALADSIPYLRAAGVTHLDVGDATMGEKCDTVPAPATVRDPQLAVPRYEPDSDRLAHEFGWLDSPGEPQIDTRFVARNVAFEERVAEGLAELLEPETVNR